METMGHTTHMMFHKKNKKKKPTLTLEMIDKAYKEAESLEQAQEASDMEVEYRMLKARKNCKHKKLARLRIEHAEEHSMEHGTKYTDITSCARCGLRFEKRTWICGHKAGFVAKMSKHKTPIKLYVCRLCGYLTGKEPKFII